MSTELTTDKQPTVMEIIAQAVLSGNVGPEVVERLWDVQEKIMDRNARTAFAEAFAAFKSKVPEIVKDSVIEVKGTIRSRYAKLDQVAEKVIPALLAEGLTHRWKTRTTDEGKTFVTCFLRHTLGHEEEGSTLAFVPDNSGSMNGLQGLGSTVSYLERYTFVASCGIVIKDWDNDGNLGISEETLKERTKRLAEISRCESSEKLTSLCRAYVGDAFKAKDFDAIKLFEQAKDKRMAELEAK